MVLVWRRSASSSFFFLLPKFVKASHDVFTKSTILRAYVRLLSSCAAKTRKKKVGFEWLA
jgi:hypothetical protein